MIYVDSNVPMYLVGSEHPNKHRVIELVSQLLTAREQLVTSAETFQEILHRYRGLGDRDHLTAAYEALETMVSLTVDITKGDVDQARAATGRYPELSSRDCLHVAAIRRLECTTIWSYDKGFDVVSAIQRIA